MPFSGTLQPGSSTKRSSEHAATPCSMILLVVVLAAQQFLCCNAQLSPLDDSSSSNDTALLLHPALNACNNEQQLIMCGDIPSTPEYTTSLMACCSMHTPVVKSAAVQAADAIAEQQRSNIQRNVYRADLQNGLAYAPNYMFAKCTTAQRAMIPTFSGKSVTLKAFNVPKLTQDIIKRVKTRVYTSLDQSIKNDIARMRTFNSRSGFQHPGTCAGPVELAYMKFRLRNGYQATTAARGSLLNGNGVKAKHFASSDGGTWHPPTSTPAEGYTGPLPMTKVQIQYSGISPAGPCPWNYPDKAPRLNCQHVSFVELDAQMAYKMALAWHATGDDRYADKVVRILDAHASTTQEWGVSWENGPLEAGWGIATMSRALELVRPKAPASIISKFVQWVNTVPMKDMDEFNNGPTRKGIPNFFSNWHATIAEAFMAFGVLSDDRARYARGVGLFHETVRDYLKWGKGNYAQGRILGECSETMRDMYHSQFAFGGLLQAAEIAWQQNEDLYSSNDYALAAAMELHARITNAWNNKDSNMLPNGFKFYEGNMPSPPAGTRWQFDMQKQRWTAVHLSNGAWHSELNDNIRYLLGVGFLPTGWEIGYNHYVGRLGMKLPETAALLAKSWPEWQEMQWGLGTITHANTAQKLWRDGIKDYTLCESRVRGPRLNTNNSTNDIYSSTGSVELMVEQPEMDSEKQVSATGDGQYEDPMSLSVVMPLDDQKAADELVLVTLSGSEAPVAVNALNESLAVGTEATEIDEGRFVVSEHDGSSDDSG